MKATSGLFDLQVNGFAGVDFNDENINADRLDIALEAMLRTGVTSCLPTLITAPFPQLVRRFQALDRAVAQSQLGALMIPGYHLEGPFLNPAEGYAGCHPPEAMVPPDIRLLDDIEKQLTRPILLVTCAPEKDEGFVFIRALKQRGKRVSIGHSCIDYSQVEAAADAGVTLCTHLGNGIPQVLPKLDNPLQAQLSCDQLQASFIADGVHIPPFALKNLLRAKTPARSILVTDAMSAAACAHPGVHTFAGIEVECSPEGIVRLPGAANLAGSSLTLDQAIRNLVTWKLSSFEEAIEMASTHPHKLMEETLLQHRQTLNESEVIWDEQYQVIQCRIGQHLTRRYH